MDKNRVKGKIKQVEGRAQDLRGDITGNVADDVEGKAKNVAGKIQEEYGKAADAARRRERKV